MPEANYEALRRTHAIGRRQRLKRAIGQTWWGQGCDFVTGTQPIAPDPRVPAPPLAGMATVPLLVAAAAAEAPLTSGWRCLGSKRRISSSLEARISGTLVAIVVLTAAVVLSAGESLLPRPWPLPLERRLSAAAAVPFLTAPQLSGCTPSTRKALGCRNTSLLSERGG